jgi:hypothetical protein
MENGSNQLPPPEMGLNFAKENIFTTKFRHKMFYNDNSPYL